MPARQIDLLPPVFPEGLASQFAVLATYSRCQQVTGRERRGWRNILLLGLPLNVVAQSRPRGSERVGRANGALDVRLAEDGVDAPLDGWHVQDQEVDEEGGKGVLKLGALGKAHVDGGDADGLEDAPLWIPRGTHLGGDEAVAERHESLGEDVGHLVLGRDQDAVELGKGPGAGEEVGG